MNPHESSGPVGYMERTRLYYHALGYNEDYTWAQYDDVPFARLSKPLSTARIALITTALPLDLADDNAMGGKQLWSRAVADVDPELSTAHVAWDRESTHTRDRESFLPINRIGDLAKDGVVGGLTNRVHGVPTRYSQRKTIEEDSPEILRRVQEDDADAVLLTPL